MVKHIVLFKLKDEVSAEEKLVVMNKFKEAIEALPAKIPVIRKVEVGLNQIEGIEEWYVFMNDSLVKYRDLMSFIKKFDYYDANHRMVCLSKEEISEALNTLAIQKI